MARPKGIPSNRKGKKLEEIFGKERAEELKKKSSKTQFKRGHNPWHKGKTKSEFPQLSNSGVKKGNVSWNTNSKVRQNKYKIIVVNGKRIKRSCYIWVNENSWGMNHIPKDWVVHHRNFNCEDDRIENLCCMPRGFHISLHHEINKRGKK